MESLMDRNLNFLRYKYYLWGARQDFLYKNIFKMMSTKRVAFKYGIIYGLVAIIFFMLQENFGFGIPTSIGVAIISFVVTIAVGLGIMYFAVKEQRDVEQNGHISIGECLKLGAVIALVSAIIFSIFNLFYIKFINPNYIIESAKRSLEAMEAWGMKIPEETYDQIEEGNNQQTPFSIAFGIFITELLGKAIYSLVCGLILKKEPKIDLGE